MKEEIIKRLGEYHNKRRNMNNHEHSFYIDSELDEQGKEIIYRYCVCGEKIEFK